MQQKIIWFTWDNIGASIVKKLIDEGVSVILAQIEDQKELGYEQKPEDPESKRRRLSVYDGIFPKKSAKIALEAMAKIKDKEKYFVIFDFNNMWNYAEKVQAMGFNGLFPTKELYEFEKDRNKAKEFVKENYPDLNLTETEEFNTVDEAKKFLEKTKEVWVLKGNNDNARTVVPETEDPEVSKMIIVESLEDHKKDYEADGFILERKILHGIEFTPEMWWLDGKPIFSSVDIENKPIGARNESVQTGCAQNLIVKTDLEDPINQIAFPPAIQEMAKKQKGLFIFDAGIMYDPENKKMYFTEFCAQRMGWDAIQTELNMAESVSSFFELVSKGENPLFYKFGASVRGYNLHKDDAKDRRVTEGLPIKIGNEKGTWIYECKMEKDRLVSTGTSWDLAVFTGASDNPNEAVDKAYESRYDFGFENMYARPKEDFISMQYHSAIPIRYTFINNNLISGVDFKEVSAFDENVKKAYEDKISMIAKDAKRFYENDYNEKLKEVENNHAETIKKLKEEFMNIINENE